MQLPRSWRGVNYAGRLPQGRYFRSHNRQDGREGQHPSQPQHHAWYVANQCTQRQLQRAQHLLLWGRLSRQGLSCLVVSFLIMLATALGSGGQLNPPPPPPSPPPVLPPAPRPGPLGAAPMPATTSTPGDAGVRPLEEGASDGGVQPLNPVVPLLSDFLVSGRRRSVEDVLWRLEQFCTERRVDYHAPGIATGSDTPTSWRDAFPLPPPWAATILDRVDVELHFRVLMEMNLADLRELVERGSLHTPKCVGGRARTTKRDIVQAIVDERARRRADRLRWASAAGTSDAGGPSGAAPSADPPADALHSISGAGIPATDDPGGADPFYDPPADVYTELLEQVGSMRDVEPLPAAIDFGHSTSASSTGPAEGQWYGRQQCLIEDPGGADLFYDLPADVYTELLEQVGSMRDVGPLPAAIDFGDSTSASSAGPAGGQWFGYQRCIIDGSIQVGPHTGVELPAPSHAREEGTGGQLHHQTAAGTAIACPLANGSFWIGQAPPRGLRPPEVPSPATIEGTRSRTPTPHRRGSDASDGASRWEEL